jgi:hypothetical protein
MCWVALIGVGLSAMGQAQAGAQSEAAAKERALVGEAQADDALARGGMEEQRYRRQVAQIAGTQRAQVGARNVRTSGTALDLFSDTQATANEDALTIRNESAREAWGYRVGADESRRWGKTARSNANWQAGSTLLTGAAQSYGVWATR